MESPIALLPGRVENAVAKQEWQFGAPSKGAEAETT
jgi:hypothetical protein